MPIVKGDLFTVLGGSTPKGRGILPPFSISSAGQIRSIEDLFPFQVVHIVPHNTVVFWMLSSGDAGPHRVVFSGEYCVDKGNGRTMLFQVLKRSQTLFVTMQKVPTESTNINKSLNFSVFYHNQ